MLGGFFSAKLREVLRDGSLRLHRLPPTSVASPPNGASDVSRGGGGGGGSSGGSGGVDGGEAPQGLVLDALRFILADIERLQTDSAESRELSVSKPHSPASRQLLQQLLPLCGYLALEDEEPMTSFRYPPQNDPLLPEIGGVLKEEIARVSLLIERSPRKAVLGEKSLSRGFPDFQGSSRFLVGFADSIGRRRTMEDEIVILGRGPRSLYFEDYFAVFDGHAGTEASGFASRTVHEHLDKFVRTNMDVSEAIRQSFLATDKKMGELGMHAGTCALVAFFQNQTMFVANLGDSRAVLGSRGGVCRRISEDHKPLVPKERERIERQGGFVKVVNGIARVMGELAVCRALGDSHLKPYVSAQPDVFDVPLLGQESFLILACDGIWDEVEDEEAAEIVYKTNDPLTASQQILKLAHSRGSTDNLSIIVIYLADRSDWDR
eukprot:TRINITY_DN73_c6_g1_i3.p1 TRINITY_DN73_c6_g1~~TRINITY_DN73_c6_g1_i3.p1  ORF type:complete len:435 (+),score=42.00 TRINITY_DN73_c6_g1_i3:140-1444(+)